MNTTNTKERTITLKRNDIYFDIDYLSLYYSFIAAGDSPEKADRVATETASTGGTRTMKRLCDHRVGEIMHMAGKYINATTVYTQNNDLVDSDWEIPLLLSTETEDNILSPLADFFHQYVVNGALADWYAHLGINGNRETLEKRANEALARARDLLYYKPMP